MAMESTINELLPKERFEAGSIIFSRGSIGNTAYVIDSGVVEVLDFEGTPLAQMGPGDLFGEVALLDSLPRTATIRAVETTTLIKIDRAPVLEMLKQSDPVVRYILTILLERYRARTGVARAVQALSMETRNRHDEMIATQTLALTQDLAHAVTSKHLELAYQPLVGFANRNLLGFEALIRWRHPLLGNVMPSKLIDLAEKTGLIHPVGEWVLRKALQDWQSLKGFCNPTANSGMFVSVNLSAVELLAPNIVESIAKALSETGTSASELKIELTETLLIEDRDHVSGILEMLSKMGVSIALDDYGTGYSSLDYLNTLPISYIKIDQRFVRDILISNKSLEIVQNSISLARSLGLKVVGEGVENEDVAARLSEMGCDIAQGYYFARPMPIGDVAYWLKDAKILGRLA